jgi:DNA polymerase-4
VEPLSLDEAYLDVTENLKGIVSATWIAEEIRARIRAETQLTASAGVSYNKFLAKLASDHNKPDGLFVVIPEMGPAFVASLPVRRFHGVGPATARKMEQLGIRTGLDLRAQTLEFLQLHFGKAGSYFYWAARAIDDRRVRADRMRKSVGAENTFPADLFTYEAARDQLQDIIEKIWAHCERSGTRGRTVTLKVKYADFRQITRSRSLTGTVDSRSVLEEVSLDLLSALFPIRKGVRLLGVTLSALHTDDEPDAPQLSLGL